MALLDPANEIQPSSMPLFPAELRVKEDPDELPRHLRSDHARPHHEDIDVVVLDPLMGGVRVVTEPGARAGVRISASSSR